MDVGKNAASMSCVKDAASMSCISEFQCLAFISFNPICWMPRIWERNCHVSHFGCSSHCFFWIQVLILSRLGLQISNPIELIFIFGSMSIVAYGPPSSDIYTGTIAEAVAAAIKLSSRKSFGAIDHFKRKFGDSIGETVR